MCKIDGDCFSWMVHAALELETVRRVHVVENTSKR